MPIQRRMHLRLHLLRKQSLQVSSWIQPRRRQLPPTEYVSPRGLRIGDAERRDRVCYLPSFVQSTTARSETRSRTRAAPGGAADRAWESCPAASARSCCPTGCRNPSASNQGSRTPLCKTSTVQRDPTASRLTRTFTPLDRRCRASAAPSSSRLVPRESLTQRPLAI
jgi:hypothetical protein